MTRAMHFSHGCIASACLAESMLHCNISLCLGRNHRNQGHEQEISSYPFRV
ncbi:hypothetical protein RHECNPAF_1340090 [Rhizobium etli CNPAF512]|nr:hypothetical protein RHECNPAF_1340090 [Rhizobium etli CNPAF512]